MSSFLKKGERIQVRKKKKEVKHRTKDFYKILNELDDLYERVSEDKELLEQITKDNMVELLQPLTDRKIGKLEEFVLLGKFGYYEQMDKELRAVSGRE